MSETRQSQRIAIIGGGPAGLMAAEVIAEAGYVVDLFDAMPSVGRKFLLAGIGGLNITHSEARENFLARYGERREQLAPSIDAFDADALREWARQLGIETFVGTSGRVFPREMKAAPLLRAWLHRLRGQGVRLHTRHRWLGWNAAGALRFATPTGESEQRPAASVLALGGASWPKLGSDGAWVPWLAARGVDIAALQPANCGFETHWSEHFRTRFAGQALKSIRLRFVDLHGTPHERIGECLITQHGLEGSLIYALSSTLRETLNAEGKVKIELDLAPGRELARVQQEVAHPRGSRSLSSHLHSRVGLNGLKTALLHEALSRAEMHDPLRLTQTIKALPLTLHATRPIDEAISSAGGVRFEAMDEDLMLRAFPGVFCAGEMLDWEAPTGGYLLTACFATGRAAARGVIAWLQRETSCTCA
ncbi:MAG: TIGR03862 family flavoprotein [Betaproteobacteria bacterium]|nr:TIGR03862 family flavoprotein [Betaproteobacteria bacterium]